MRLFEIPYIVHMSTDDTVRNGDGSTTYVNPKTGAIEPLTQDMHPDFDTMIAVANNGIYDTELTFVVDLSLEDSWEQTHVLRAKQSIAMSFIEFNPFTNVPSDFMAKGRVIAVQPSSFHPKPDVHVTAMIGGGGTYPKFWNNFSASLPVYEGVPSKNRWVLPYAIKYMDNNHGPFAYERTVVAKPWLNGTVYEDHSYRTGLVLTNYENEGFYVSVRYRVGFNYLGSGDMFEFVVPLGAHEVRVLDLFDELENVTYQAGRNSEGYLEISTLDNQPRKFVPYAIASNQAYNQFSGGIFAS